MSTSSQHLVIIGGGMVGASLAIALSGSGLRITLVEAFSPKTDSLPSYDDRAIALAYGTRKIFESMGVWDALKGSAEPIKHIHISDKGRFGQAHLDSEEQQVPALGYVALAREMGRVLLDALYACDDVEVIAPAKLINFSADDAGIDLQLEIEGQPREMRADLLVAADGGKSFVREKLELPVQHWQYGQSAVIANITPEKKHENIAYERFTESGPVALLPMTEERCAVVWTVEDENVEEVLSLSDDEFLQSFQTKFGYRLGRFQRVGKRSSYPLTLLRATQSTSKRAVVIGNAAHTLHPIAGQGFNLGIRDVAALVDVLQQSEGDIGSDEVLESYENWRLAEQRNVALATDALARIFGNPLPPVRLARNIGLIALQHCPPAKSFLASAAMGLFGKKPRLTRGVRHD